MRISDWSSDVCSSDLGTMPASTCARAGYSARAQVEAGMVPWASDRLFDDKTANKWRAVVRAERTNGEQSAGAPDKQYCFAACMALQHGSFGKFRKRNAQGEFGSGHC